MNNQLTIGIVTFNASDDISACLKSIEANRSRDYRIMVADNNSVDNTRDTIAQEFPNVEVINTGGNFGYGHAVNSLLARTTTPLLLLLNADITITDSTIEPLIAHLQSDENCIVASPITYDGKGNLEGNIRMFPTIFRTIATCLLGGRRAEKIGLCDISRKEVDYQKTHNVDWLKGAIWCMRVKESVELGGMREDFFLYSEEREFAARALDHSYTSAIVTASHASHEGGDSDFDPVLYALLHINNIRYELARHKRVSAGVTYFMQLLTEGLPSRKPQHRYAFTSHLRAAIGVEKEAKRLVNVLGGEKTEPVFKQSS